MLDIRITDNNIREWKARLIALREEEKCLEKKLEYASFLSQDNTLVIGVELPGISDSESSSQRTEPAFSKEENSFPTTVNRNGDGQCKKTVDEIAEEVLRKNGAPMSAEDLFKEVHRQERKLTRYALRNTLAMFPDKFADSTPEGGNDRYWELIENKDANQEREVFFNADSK